MKYLLLVHHNEEAFGQMSDATRKAMLAESIQLCHQLKGTEQYVHASPLQPIATATVVRVRDGKRSITDGPFAETHEQLAGYFLVEAKDLDGAIDVAGRIPGARIGAVEVRPVREIAGLPGK
ncbi:MAG: YciI family protein [Nitrospirae bacterium]|nr:YciI family protein [Nitrospirota bacterium]MDE3039253.1 YciI family protein [Nitrospirota bacterium]